MSFRTRLVSFFLLIVVVPMIAVGVLVYRLIGASEQGKADARASGIAGTAASLYARDTAVATADARRIAHDRALLNQTQLQAALPGIAARSGLARVSIAAGPR